MLNKQVINMYEKDNKYNGSDLWESKKIQNIVTQNLFPIKLGVLSMYTGIFDYLVRSFQI